MSRPHDVFDRATIEAILPHRHPFLFVDRIVDYEPERWIVGTMLVSRNNRFLSPDGATHQSLPPAILMEAMAQVGALLVLANPAHRDKLAVVTSVARARYRGGVRVGEEVRIRVTLERRIGPMGRVAGAAHVDGRRVGSGSMQFLLVPRDLRPEGLQRLVS